VGVKQKPKSKPVHQVLVNFDFGCQPKEKEELTLTFTAFEI
jgi:hypothetical protein